MLQRIRIDGYRSCKGVEIEGTGPITALVGRNGSGKTNVLLGISRLARLASSQDLSSLPAPSPLDRSSSECYAADVQLSGNLYRYGLELRLPEDSSGPEWTASLTEQLALIHAPGRAEVLFSRDGQTLTTRDRPEPLTLALGRMAPALPAVSALLPEGAGLLRHTRPLLQFFRRMVYDPFEEPNEVSGGVLVSDNEFQAWVARRGSAGGTPSSIMWLIHACYNAREKFDELCALLGPTGLDLISTIKVDSFDVPMDTQQPGEIRSRYHAIRFYPGGLLGGGNTPLYYPQLSLGTRRVLRILTALILGNRHLMLIEHPEEGIHPGLLKKLAGLLRDNADPVQIILSSHSPEVFNSLRGQDIRLVTIQDGATNALSLTPPQVKAAAEYIREEGTLAEFLATTQEVQVYGLLAEDDSDVQTLATIIRRLACNSSLSIRGIGYDGCAPLLRKGASGLRNLARQGCTRFVVCYDADGPDGAVRRQVVMGQIITPSGLAQDTCLALVPVQEIEAWVLADADHAIPHLIRSWRPDEVLYPENVASPKEELARRSRDSMRRPRYSYTTHNPRVAIYLDLERLHKKCPSFRPLSVFVTNDRPLHPPQRGSSGSGRGVRAYARHGEGNCANVGLVCAPQEWAEFTRRVGARLAPSPGLRHLCCFGWTEVFGLGAELDVFLEEDETPTVRMVAQQVRAAVAYHAGAQQIGLWDGLSHRCPACELTEA